MTEPEWQGIMASKLDDLVTILYATPEVRDAYDSPFDVLFAVCVEAVSTYIKQWADLDDTGSLTVLVLNADDLEDPARIADPNAKVETLFRLMFLDALLYNVRHRLGLPEWKDDDKD